MNDIITKEQVLNAYNNAPDLVRAAFNDEKTTQVIVGLKARFELHVDSAGLLGKGVGHMLLGLLSPPAFLEKLLSAGIPDADARQIMTEINQKIFVPLREEMRRGAPVAPGPAKPATPPRPQSAASSLAPRQVYEPPPQSPSYFHLQNKIPPPSYIPPRPVQPPRPPVAPGVGGPRPPVSSAAKPLDSSRMLEDHEEPHINIGASEKVQVVSSPTIQPPVSASLKPSNLPLTPAPPPPPTQPYTTDPYREPIE